MPTVYGVVDSWGGAGCAWFGYLVVHAGGVCLAVQGELCANNAVGHTAENASKVGVGVQGLRTPVEEQVQQ